MTRTTVIARLNDRVQPLDRGTLYEDPLDYVLKESSLGAVTGGGTLVGDSGEVEYCEVEVELAEASPRSLEIVTKVLERMGAPKGSLLIVDERELHFGALEGLAVYLNGTDLPASVYRDCDINVVYDEFARLLEGAGTIHSYWEGPTETALYMYGDSFESMKSALGTFLDSYPLCERARVVQVA